MEKNTMEINGTQNCLVTNILQITHHFKTTLLGKPVQLFDNTNC